jgi:DNA invertase Pin-like site-specific DNA recombinase
MDAQKRMVEGLRNQHGAEVIASFTEIETGTNKRKRPQLAAALAKCRETGATLVIAKLDRLARDVYFIAGLIRGCKVGVPFVCCDMPEADETTIYIMAAFAEREAKVISARTKAGLESAKLKGKKLGSARPGHWEGKEHLRGVFSEGMKKARQSKSEEIRNYYESALPHIRLMRLNGDSLAKIVAWLNNTMKFRTYSEKPFTEIALHRVISRYLDAKYLGRMKVSA